MNSVIIFGAKDLIFVVIVLLAVVWVKLSRRDKITSAASIFIAGAIALGLKALASWLYTHPRPFVSQHIKPLISHIPDNGFPSEHTIFGITLSGIIYYYNRPLGILAYVTSVLVGISRVLAHVHSPIDIVGGILVGGISAAVGLWLANKLTSRYKKASTNAADQLHHQG